MAKPGVPGGREIVDRSATFGHLGDDDSAVLDKTLDPALDRPLDEVLCGFEEVCPLQILVPPKGSPGTGMAHDIDTPDHGAAVVRVQEVAGPYLTIELGDEFLR